jgi:Fe-S-cluster containining protein
LVEERARTGPQADVRGEPRWAAALSDLEALYADLDRELPKYRFTCVASGACCDFDAYGHRLYATTLEAEWFFRNSPEQRANASERHCPAWGPDRLCKARAGRMLGCRTYFCGPYPNGLPEDVHAPFHAKIQALHDKHGIPYRYRDILDWAKERRPAP